MNVLASSMACDTASRAYQKESVSVKSYFLRQCHVVLRCEGGNAGMCTADDACESSCHPQSKAVAPIVGMQCYRDMYFFITSDLKLHSNAMALNHAHRLRKRHSIEEPTQWSNLRTT